MAIYRLESRILGRNQGHTSVGYAAYLAAEKLYDERYNEERDFTKKRLRDRLYYSEIVAPENAPAWTQNRQELWNRNEAAEKRKDSQVGRELVIALPQELTHDQKIKLGLQFIREEYAAKGMVADVNFHNFKGKGSDNPHMQVLLTTRRIEGDKFAAKKEEAWRPPIVKDPRTGKAKVDPEFIKAERKVWEHHCNRALERAGLEQRVDCRSLKEQGIDRLPQPKLGKAHHMEQRKEWEGKTRAGDRLREVEDINALKAELEEFKAQQREITHQARETLTRYSYELGQDLAREEQADRQRGREEQPSQAPPPAPAPERKQENRGLEPWKRDWERQLDDQRKRRVAGEKAQERKGRIQRKEETAADQKQRPAAEPATPKTPAPPRQDDRHLIEQWQQFFERERGKPRATAHDSQAERPAPGRTTPEQQVAKLREEMAAFEAEDAKWEYPKRRQPDKRNQEAERQRQREQEQDEIEL